MDDPSVDREDNLRRMKANSIPKYIHKDIKKYIATNKPIFDQYRRVESIVILGWSLGQEDRKYMDWFLDNTDAKIYVAVRNGVLEKNFIDYMEQHPEKMRGRRFIPVLWEDLPTLNHRSAFPARVPNPFERSEHGPTA